MLFFRAEPHKRGRFLKTCLNNSPEKPYVARIFGTFDLLENCEKNARNQAQNVQIRERAKREKPRKRSVFKAFYGGGKGIRTLVGVSPNGFQDRLVMTTSISLRI